MEDGVLKGLDDQGEFEIDPPRGMDEPQDGRCNAVLRRTQQRYGETRYCGMLPVGTFGDATDYDHAEYCKNHQPYAISMERASELVRHGAFGQNYVVFEKALEPHEFIFSVEMFGGLLERSQYDYDVTEKRRKIDTTDSDLINDDEVVVTLPMPDNPQYEQAAQELWFLCLDEIVEQRMQRIRITQGVDSNHVVATADDDGVITDRIEERSESHLNLPISRLSKDKKERMKMGGIEVGVDEDDSAVTFERNEYTLDVSEMEPEEEAVEDIEELKPGDIGSEIEVES